MSGLAFSSHLIFYILFNPIIHNIIAISDDEMLSEAPLSPLSIALDTAVLEASSRATDSNTTTFMSKPSDTARMNASDSNTGGIITIKRNRLGDDIIEASKYLRAWWDSGIIKKALQERRLGRFGPLTTRDVSDRT
jgi:hypothetical protein